MNSCIRTGANVWTDLGYALHGDLYILNSTLVLRHTGQERHDIGPEDCEAVMMLEAARRLNDSNDYIPDLLELDGDYPTIIITENAVRFSHAFHEELVELGYCSPDYDIDTELH
jgi:hypothetical protein